MDYVPADIIGFAEKCQDIPVYGWHAAFNQKEIRSSPPKPPSIKTVAEFASMAVRYMSRVYFPRKREKTLPFMDPLNPVKMEPMYGVPLGGIGCGTIGRGYKGEFCRSSLRPGLYNYRVNPVDQFIVTVKRADGVYQQVLSPSTSTPRKAAGLHSWNWGFPANRGHYVGLYPRSWTVYNLPKVNIVLICEQLSPIIPGNYKDSCLPLGTFRWSVLNFDPDEEATVSITFTWRGSRYKYRPPPPNAGRAGEQCCKPIIDGPNDAMYQNVRHIPRRLKRDITIPFDSEDNRLRGCLMETRIDESMPCCFGIAARASDQVDATRCMGFNYNTLSKHHHSHGRQRDSNDFAKHRKSSSNSCETETVNNVAEPSDFSRFSFLTAPSAADLWLNLKLTGALADDSKSFIRESEWNTSWKMGIAVCATCTVPPAKILSSENEPIPGRRTLDFFLTWHIPRVHFRSAINAYKRRYTRWFAEDMVMGAGELLSYAADNVDIWRKAIEEWQAPILNNPTLPNWYKSALFNELYFVSDGGTVWLDPVARLEDNPFSHSEIPPIDFVRSANRNLQMDPLQLTGRDLLKCVTASKPKHNLCQPPNKRIHSREEKQSVASFQARTAFGKEMGLFAYLEGHEYRMFNTYDVHFNASWALIQLWPKIQLAMNYDMADITLSEDSTSTNFMYKSIIGKRNSKLLAPHDCGDPENEPWVNVNAYVMYPTDSWKDLNPKFVLMAWRDWKLTQDSDYLLYMLPILVSVVRNSLNLWDHDGDGIIENEGFPDQTYDMWKTSGLGAYVGGLWISALYGINEMLTAARQFTSCPAGRASSWAETEDDLAGLLQRAKMVYHECLWEGNFYRLDLNASQIDAPVLADQLSGYWFLRMGGAPSGAVLSIGSVARALKTIVDLNWKSVNNGKMGAINSIYSNGKPDYSNMQAEEFWVAVSYSLGSLLIVEGKSKDGFSLAGSCFEHVYNQMGLHFQTPEAFTKDNTFRSLGYMRPLAIWSIHRALEIVDTEKLIDDQINDQEQFHLVHPLVNHHHKHIPSS